MVDRKNRRKDAIRVKDFGESIKPPVIGKPSPVLGLIDIRTRPIDRKDYPQEAPTIDICLRCLQLHKALPHYSGTKD